ncbi:MAG: hypothetical protein PVI71_05875 [Desulfobacterales bacterium]|jgi:hypothetical protein
MSSDLSPPEWSSATEVKNVLVVPLSFPGQNRYGDLKSIKRRWGEGLRRYIRELSYGKVQLNIDVASWIKMPKPISAYSLSSWRIIKWTLKDQARRTAIVQDAGTVLDSMYDLSTYDGLFLVVGASWKNFGRYGYLCRTRSGFFEIWTPSGKLIPPTDVHTYDVPFPSIAYAIPKILGGYKDRHPVVPTLYDYLAQGTSGPHGYGNEWIGGNNSHQYFSIYAGPWDIQSQHGIPTPRGFMAQGLSSFNRLRLGWIDPGQTCTVQPGQSRTVLLGPLWDGHAETLVIRLPLDHSCCYYLIENRQRKGVDRYLPSEGVLILKVDETIPEGNGPVRVVSAHPMSSFFRNAPFKEGEEFRDQENGILVKVLSKDDSGYRLQIRRNSN